MSIVRVRVRGIYSTAISKMLVDNGFELVDVTQTIAERLGIPQKIGLPADATVKSDDDEPSQLLVLGFPEAVNRITSVLIEGIPDILIYNAKLGLYSCFKSIVIGKENNCCLVKTPVGIATLLDEPKCIKGEEIPVTVVKVPVKSDERTAVSSNLRVVGRYAILGKGSGVSFSNFIRSKERISELLKISSDVIKNGYSVRWRSNADEADLNDIATEIPKLIEELKHVENKVRKAKPLEIVYPGEHMSILELTYNSKVYLDSIRSKVAPTAPYHHILKSSRKRNDIIVDLLDIIASDVEKEKIVEWVHRWLANLLLSRKEIVLYHKRPLKKNILLKGMMPLDVSLSDRAKIKLKRNIRSRGTYDGLNVRKEVGDYSVTTVEEGRWHIVHRYYSKEGILKGSYVNINTPPEILPEGSVRYVDLGVDLVKPAGHGCKLIDTPEFRKLITDDLITSSTISNIVKELEKLILAYCT